MIISCSNESIFLDDFDYDWYFMPSLFKFRHKKKKLQRAVKYAYGL